MTAELYDTGRTAFLTADIDWVADDIRVVLVDTALYTVDLAADNFLDDIPVGARVATSAASLANKTASVGGIADADDIVIAAVSGATIEAIVLYRHTGVDATSQLIAYVSDADVTNFPMTPNGGDITVAWSNGANKIFKL